MKKENTTTLVGFITVDDGTKCIKCKAEKHLVQVDVDDNIKGLPVIKQYILCKKCCKEMKLVLPENLSSFNLD